MKKINRYGDRVVTTADEVVGAVVDSNCGGLTLADGTPAVWGGVINPEYGQVREYLLEDGSPVLIPLGY